VTGEENRLDDGFKTVEDDEEKWLQDPPTLAHSQGEMCISPAAQ
jgi:hypothetical protein